MKRFFAMLLSVPCAALALDSLSVAKDALRDGLWDVARTYAAKADGDDARLVFIESYARAGKWPDVLSTLELHSEYEGDGFSFYRALALERLGRGAEALKALDSCEFEDSSYSLPAKLLRLCLARESGDAAAILAMVPAKDFPSAEPDAMLEVAWAEETSGDGMKATNIWRSVLAMTNAPGRAVAEAAKKLGDAQSLSSALERVGDPELRRSVALHLGCARLADGAAFDEGASAISSMAKDYPDAEGVKEAFLRLAQAYFEKERWEDAAKTFSEAMEAWPETARSAAAQEQRGWALRNLGKAEEAIEAYSRSAECATNDADRARAVMEQGDVLAAEGRGAEAMDKYRDVLAKYPDTPIGRELKTKVELRDMESDARTKYGDFRFAEAAEVFDEIARRDSSRRPRMEYFGMLCLYGQGRDDEAAAKALGIATSSPDPEIRAEATLWLAKFSFNGRRWSEARDRFALYATNLAPKSAQAPSALVWSARAAFAARDCDGAIALVKRLSSDCPDSAEKASGWLVQGEALVELARLDEALLVLDRIAKSHDADPADVFRARMLAADVLFVMGADSPGRYKEALDAYRSLEFGETATPSGKLVLAFKIGRTLEKMGRTDEAKEQYYARVVEEYRSGRSAGLVYDEEAMSTFARAAFLLADMLERAGDRRQAGRMLRLVEKSDVETAIPEALRRRERLRQKGNPN